MGDQKLPFIAEYSKSNRSRCRTCNNTIDKDVLRLGVIVQATGFDGKIPAWHHEGCFFNRAQSTNEENDSLPVSEWEIARFQQLRYEDQIRLRDKIASTVTIAAFEVSSSEDEADKEIKPDKTKKDINEGECSTAMSISCSKCNRIIEKDEFVKETIDGKDACFHFVCFREESTVGQQTKHKDLETIDLVSGCSSHEVVHVLDDDDVPAKKTKLGLKSMVDGSVATTQEQQIAEQQKAFYALRDRLKAFNIDKLDLVRALRYNDQNVPSGLDAILDQLCDVMMFGALECCPNCGGQFEFQETAYVCRGSLTKWTKCLNKVTVPLRRKTEISADLKKKYIIFREYECVLGNRIIRQMTQVPFNGERSIKERNKTKQQPLANMQFVIIGKPAKTEKQLTAKILQMGGKVVQEITKHTAAIISTKEEVQLMSSRIQEAKDLQIQVVLETFIESVTGGDVLSLIASQAICDWGSDPHTRSPTKSEAVKSLPSKMKFQMKSGLIVDPDSGLTEQAHVYKKGDVIYNCVLNLVDIQRDLNSYYKMQVLEEDNKEMYWLFRAWGRIGTTIGSHKLQEFKNANGAVEEFHELFFQKTRNNWIRHDSPYKKQAGLFFPIEIDYSEKNMKSLTEDSAVKSNLKPAVQDLMRMIFNVEEMNRVMLEFELDMEKMPLGKLSQRQLQSAMTVLSEIALLIAGRGSPTQFIDASNRFYSFVPHNFGLNSVNVIDTVAQIKEKLAMLENLMQIEFAYSLLNVDKSNDGKSVLDVHYERLKTNIEPMDRSTEDFALLQQYVRNTHAATHKDYELEIEEVFCVKRQDEDKRYEPFRGLHNRKLLWHGSRLTNFVGILSNGLKIAPPEAPATGYMFGKGIYFADMVSKSANYCFTNPADSKGLMLLCEVALGDMQEYTRASYVEKLPSGRHSVKGIGRTQPDPTASHIRPDGVEIPLGKGVTNESMDSSLLYNEFIVYDVAQVNSQYLLKMKFLYKV
ncbi:poly [ADP-ribose] polymerase-like [Anopheles ziemanni]|uniref:poly [ADP-ribose] polymerase-like n=1 Tax=Anopheles ziemanni TaxID=345580 RepID=UPI00265F1A38|nr:poly [ADP-ribose] polymerase-like [Anopheles ziemanni]